VPDFSKLDRRLAAGFYTANSGLTERYGVSELTDVGHPVHPNHLALFFEPALWQLESDLATDPASAHEMVRKAMVRAAGVVWHAKGLVPAAGAGRPLLQPSAPAHSPGTGGDGCTDANAVANAPSEGTQDTCARIARLLRASSVVVGLHPDQATDHIVDYALAFGKPFAVVPCCTFAKLFPRRRTGDGRQVRSYEQLLDHLQAKHPAIRRTTVDGMAGRNVVLYSTVGLTLSPELAAAACSPCPVANVS